MTVTVVPDRDAVATPVLLDDTEMAPSPLRVTVNVSESMVVSRLMDALERVMLPVVFWMTQATSSGSVSPFGHL